MMSTKNEHENPKLKKELLKQRRKISELINLKVAPNTINLIINNNWKQSERYKFLLAEHKQIVKNSKNNLVALKKWQAKHDQAYREFANVLGLNHEQITVFKNTVVVHKSVFIKNNNVNKLNNFKVNNSKVNYNKKQDNPFDIDAKKVKENIKLLKSTNVSTVKVNNQLIATKSEEPTNDNQIKIPKNIHIIKNNQTKDRSKVRQIKITNPIKEVKKEIGTIKSKLANYEQNDEFIVDVSKRPNFVEQILNENKKQTNKKVKNVKPKPVLVSLVKPIKKTVKINNAYYQEDYEMIYDQNKRPSLNTGKATSNLQTKPTNITNSETKHNVNKFINEFKKLDETKKKRYEKWVARKNRKIAKKFAHKAKKHAISSSQINLVFSNTKPPVKNENSSLIPKSVESQNDQERNERIAALNSLRKKYADTNNIDENESYGTRYFKAISDALREENAIDIGNAKTGNNKNKTW